MARRRSPTRSPENLPLWSFAFRQVHICVTGRRGRRYAVILHAEARVVSLGPLVQWCQKAIVEQLGNRLTPVMPDGHCLRSNVRDQGRQVRLKVIASSLFELFQKIAGPILIVNFQAVAEDCVRWIRAE